MVTTTLFLNGTCQAVRLPKAFYLPGSEVSIRRIGAGVFIEPIRETAWPEGFFESIQIHDAAFVRPEQGTAPLSPNFSA